MTGAPREASRRPVAPLLFGAAVATFALDQAVKWLVLDALGLIERLRLDVLPGLFSLRMAWNQGVNFGLLASGSDLARWTLIALSIGVSVAVAVWALRRGQTLFTLGAGLLIGGALGNALDRVRFGAVADFLNVTCCGLRNPWAFNVADIAIFVGALTLALAPSGEAPRAATEERR